MEVCSIASGSSGNCIYVSSGSTSLLVDVGISGKRIEEGLNSFGLKTADIDGILITHEHSDHIAGLGVISRKLGIPIYATRGTIEAVKGIKALGELPGSLFNEIRAGNAFKIKDIDISPVKTSHDAAEPVAFRLSHGGGSVGILTDLGTYNDQTVENFKGVESILIEANHDVNMLLVGKRYPYALKQRILSDKGHLSNETCGKLLCRLLHDGLKRIMLGHLSMENNLAELAYETVRLEILMDKCRYKPEDFDIRVAKRSECTVLC